MGLLVHWNGWGKNIWAREYINTVLIEQRTETEKETQNIQGYAAAAAAAAKSHQSCPTLCDPMDWSLPGSSFHGILQARVLEWVAIAFSVQGHRDNYKSCNISILGIPEEEWEKEIEEIF